MIRWVMLNCRREAARSVLVTALFCLGLLGTRWDKDAALPEPHIIRGASGRYMRCSIHGTPLRRDTVEIAYGLIVFRPGYAEAQAADFPHAESYVLGGCVDHGASEPTAEVAYCFLCRAAERAYVVAVAEARSAKAPGGGT